jgi:hypothetical protein
MERVYLAWSIENWLTIILMAALGYLLFALVSQVFMNVGLMKKAA